MEFNEYQKEAHKTAQYPPVEVIQIDLDDGDEISWDATYIYPTLGLVGEAGEVAEKIKKVVRNKCGNMSKEDIKEIAKELGDVLWYVGEIASCLDLKLNDVAQGNLDKLSSRADRGVIKSKGDNR